VKSDPAETCTHVWSTSTLIFRIDAMQVYIPHWPFCLIIAGTQILQWSDFNYYV